MGRQKGKPGASRGPASPVLITARVSLEVVEIAPKGVRRCRAVVLLLWRTSESLREFINMCVAGSIPWASDSVRPGQGAFWGSAVLTRCWVMLVLLVQRAHSESHRYQGGRKEMGPKFRAGLNTSLLVSHFKEKGSDER